jgi:hypothetical protein
LGSNVLSERRIEFNGGDAIRVLQQLLRQRAAPRSDLDYEGSVVATSGLRDPIEGFTFDQEMLPESLTQVSPVC